VKKTEEIVCELLNNSQLKIESSLNGGSKSNCHNVAKFLVW